MNDPQISHLPLESGALFNKWTKMLDRRRRNFKSETHWAMFFFFGAVVLLVLDYLAETSPRIYLAEIWFFTFGCITWIASLRKDQSNPWKTISPDIDADTIEAVRSQLIKEKKISRPVLTGFVIGATWYVLFQEEKALINWYTIFSWSGPGLYLLGGLVFHLVVRYFHFNAIRADLKLVDEVEKVAL